MSECARCPLRSRKAIVAVHPSAYALSRVTITIWKDMFTKRPADGQAVLARRTIWETAPIFGYWNGEGDCLVCGTDGWTLKDFDLWKWRAVKGALPPWPVPGPVKGWSYVWHTPSRRTSSPFGSVAWDASPPPFRRCGTSPTWAFMSVSRTI